MESQLVKLQQRVRQLSLDCQLLQKERDAANELLARRQEEAQ
jgi:hypothetical protein